MVRISFHCVVQVCIAATCRELEEKKHGLTVYGHGLVLLNHLFVTFQIPITSCNYSFLFCWSSPSPIDDLQNVDGWNIDLRPVDL
jgi:hypothetical protein